MKKKIIVLGLMFFSIISVGQNNNNTFPITGNVGIGTTSPALKLDVRSTLISGTDNLTFFGAYSNFQGVSTSTGLYIKYRADAFPGTAKSSVIQFNTGDLSLASSRKGFIEFNKSATTNTTISAMSFGSNDVEYMRINQNGKVRIGNGTNDLKTPDGYKLFVEEGILTEKLKVSIKNGSNWSDYVFNEEYNLMSLNDVEAFVKENKHLPNVPSATEMVEGGLDVAQMDAKLLEKIEELTLYIIEQNKQIEELKTTVQILIERK